MTDPEKDNPVYRSGLDDERLAYMAGYADTITLRLLDGLGLGPEEAVLDLGAGSSTQLGDKIQKTGATYLALDSNPHAITEHKQAGHNAFLGTATELPFESGGITAVNARFSMSWLGQVGREKAWDELCRVGAPNLKGVITEYDWSVAGGSAEFEVLVTSMRQVLEGLGFEPDYGASVYQDTQRLLKERKSSGLKILKLREPIPAETLDEKKAVVALTAQSVMAILQQVGRPEDAKRIEAQLIGLHNSSATADDVVLPEIVSVTFALGEAPEKKPNFQRQIGTIALNELTLALPEIDKADADLPVWRLQPKLLRHPLRAQARTLFAKIYKQAGYFDDSGLTLEALREATDPEEVFQRSEIFIATDRGGHLINTVRLIHPNEHGVSSLPTGKKLLSTYGGSLLPANGDKRETGEIAAFASLAKDSLITVRSIIALMEAAADAKMKYVLFAAVAGGPDAHFKNLFGPAIRHLVVNDQKASVIVSGTGYPGEGIELKAGYLDSDEFLTNMIDFYQTSKDKNRHANYIIKLCQNLRSRQKSVRP